MKILITGARGLLGSNLALMYSEEGHEVIATGINKPEFSFCRNHKLDITNKKCLHVIKEENPDMVINCAALANIDYCEEHPEEAEKLNAIGAKNIAEICREIDCYFVHISTDAVFDGKKGYYSEEDAPNPLHIYGKTKLMGDELVGKIGGRYAIVRTTLYGWNHENKFSLAELILNKLENNQQFSGFVDLHFSPILVNNLGEAILELYKKNYHGIINIAGPERVSKLDFAIEVANVFKLDKNLITSSSSKEVNFKAKRAEDISLNVNKAKLLLNTTLLNTEEGIRKFKSLRENGFVDRLKHHNI